jgi:hypothetical protein
MHATIDLQPLLGYLDPSTFIIIVRFHDHDLFTDVAEKAKDPRALLNFLQTDSKFSENLRFNSEATTQLLQKKQRTVGRLSSLHDADPLHLICLFLIHRTLGLNRIVHILIP